ncbi:uncharacterized protein LOC5515026 isoform X1 [Nematostella vectensis]|uniref:uncharacterized protein LOC5515026 isoform X1 n=1 Tax=Nematostella vectensis TaxID=45351 RepID=UPI002076D835|nr:uncharacterized protein LOC5515026 isoform X1 [Nematostella vectensis]
MPKTGRNRVYPDLDGFYALQKYKFIRGLIKAEHSQRRHQFNKQAAEWTSKAIVSLSLAEGPIKSPKQASQLEGIGKIIKTRLDEIIKDDKYSVEPPNPGCHASTGSGLLVALLNESEAIGLSDGGRPLVPEDDLKEACACICDEKFNIVSTLDGAAAMCPAWWRINVLISRGYIKKRSRGKKTVYELLPPGEDVAHRLRGTHILPAPQRLTVSKNTAKNISAQSSSKQFDSLYCTDTGDDGVTLLVDIHELGGDNVRLGELSRRLNDWGVQHKSRSLLCGDYQWLWRANGCEYTLPVLLERKRADDLADSIKDGRYTKQKDRMLAWRDKFGILSDDVSLQYLVESTPAAYRVGCMDGCNGVGKCGNPSVEQVEAAVEDLRASRDFTLVETRSIEGSVEYLASVTTDLKRRVSRGDFEALRLLNKGTAASTAGGVRERSSIKRMDPSATISKSCSQFDQYDELNSPSCMRTTHSGTKVEKGETGGEKDIALVRAIQASLQDTYPKFGYDDGFDHSPRKRSLNKGNHTEVSRQLKETEDSDLTRAIQTSLEDTKKATNTCPKFNEEDILEHSPRFYLRTKENRTDLIEKEDSAFVSAIQACLMDSIKTSNICSKLDDECMSKYSPRIRSVKAKTDLKDVKGEAEITEERELARAIKASLNDTTKPFSTCSKVDDDDLIEYSAHKRNLHSEVDLSDLNGVKVTDGELARAIQASLNDTPKTNIWPTSVGRDNLVYSPRGEGVKRENGTVDTNDAQCHNNASCASQVSADQKRRKRYRAIQIDDLFDDCVKKRPKSEVEAAPRLNIAITLNEMGSHQEKKQIEILDSQEEGAFNPFVDGAVYVFDARSDKYHGRGTSDWSNTCTGKASSGNQGLLTEESVRNLPENSLTKQESNLSSSVCVTGEDSSDIYVEPQAFYDKEKIGLVIGVMHDCSQAAVQNALFQTKGSVEEAIVVLLDNKSDSTPCDVIDLT